NVFSVEVEGALLSHSDVNEAAVIGMPDEKWGEAVTAIVELKDGSTCTEADLIAHCKSKIGSVKSPKTLRFCDQLPRNNNGKILKNTIRDQFAELMKLDGVLSFAGRCLARGALVDAADMADPTPTFAGGVKADKH